ncbi:tetratricopeptide repeat protein [Krasilnikovia sp. M28-CT-15]|uniref:tetratricopeptide repeat protein n=1 Tax=Krasilnikovia sp. M28-CT-15 TaxID=3373540 RepID=UPI003876DF1E
MRRSAIIISVGVLAVALVVAGGALLPERGGRGAAVKPVSATAGGDGTAPLEERVRRLPGDWNAWAELGAAYVQRARATADPSHYASAERALRRSLQIRPQDNAPALTGLGALAAARHDFTAALRHGRDALTADPYRASAYGVVADALVELGRYDEGFQAVQQMVDLRPDTASYARASYAWELRGDLDRARATMDRALEAAASPSDAAFALYQLGELAFGSGDLATAAQRFDEGLRRDPSYLPLRVGQAKVRAARGDRAGAQAGYRAVLAVAPLPGYAAELGDLLADTGDERAAEQQYGLVRVAREVQAAAGVAPDVEVALFDADHRQPARALAAARQIYDRQPSITAADALAWALHASGRSADAVRYADEAVRLGTRSALLRYHRGMVLAAAGQVAAARADLEAALRMNPHFSVRHAPIARRTLASLGGAR